MPSKMKRSICIRHRKLIETSSEHFLDVLNKGSVSTNVYLRRAHNFAMGMHWLPWPVLPKLHWPPVKYKDKRAITFEEHQKIINREHNPATRAYFQLLWHLGGSQTDIATLRAEDIDWNDRTIAYQRCKTGVTSLISFGDEVAAILEPAAGIGTIVSRTGPNSRTPSLQTFHQTTGDGWHQRRIASFLSLRLGGAREMRWLSRTFCDAKLGTREQGSSSRLFKEGTSENTAAGGIRAQARAKDCAVDKSKASAIRTDCRSTQLKETI